MRIGVREAESASAVGAGNQLLRVEPDHPADYYDRPREALDIYREAIAAGDGRALTESGAGLARLGKTEEASGRRL